MAAKLQFGQASTSPFDASYTRLNRSRDPIEEHGDRINIDNFCDSAEQSFPSQSLFEGVLNGKLSNTDRLESNGLLAHSLKIDSNLITNDADNHMRISRSVHSSAPLQRDISPTGINPAQTSNRVVGSGSLYSRRRNDLEAGQKSLFDLNSDKCIAPELQQQLHANKQVGLPGMTRGTVGGAANDTRMDSRDHAARGMSPYDIH